MLEVEALHAPNSERIRFAKLFGVVVEIDVSVGVLQELESVSLKKENHTKSSKANGNSKEAPIEKNTKYHGC